MNLTEQQRAHIEDALQQLRSDPEFQTSPRLRLAAVMTTTLIPAMYEYFSNSMNEINNLIREGITVSALDVFSVIASYNADLIMNVAFNAPAGEDSEDALSAFSHAILNMTHEKIHERLGKVDSDEMKAFVVELDQEARLEEDIGDVFR